MAIRWAITIQNGNLHPSAVMDVKSVNWQWRELERENRLPERKRDGRVELVKADLWLRSGPQLILAKNVPLRHACKVTSFVFYVPFRGMLIWNDHLCNNNRSALKKSHSNNDTASSVSCKNCVESVRPKVIRIDYFTNIIQKMKLNMLWIVSCWWMS